MPQRIPELDGIRGTAILIVIIFHWLVLESNDLLPEHLLDFGKFGWSGVDLFFVLSGFLITGILIDARESLNYYKTFYIRRFYRILPLYFLVLILVVFLYCLNLPTQGWLFESFLPPSTYLVFAQNIAMAVQQTFGGRAIDATWSLAVEEQFYLTLPFLIKRVHPKNLPRLFLACIILAPIIRICLFFTFGADQSAAANYVLLFCRMDALCLGALGAWAIRERRIVEAASPRLITTVSALLFIGIVIFTHLKVTPASFLLISIGYTWIGLFYFSLLWIAVTKADSIVARVFRLRILVFCGTIAYGLYLLHQPVLGIVHGLAGRTSPDLNSPEAFLLTLAAGCCLLVATYLSWHYFEKPFVTKGSKFKYARKHDNGCSSNTIMPVT